MHCLRRRRHLGLLASITVVLSSMAATAAPSAWSAPACSPGYSYAGLIGERTTAGVAATISAAAPRLASGHVAGWVNMGDSQSRWLQVGLETSYTSAGEPSSESLYVEVKHTGSDPHYTPLGSIAFGQPVRVAISAVSAQAGWWQVAVDGQARGDYYLGQGLEPSVLAEDWQASGDCNALAYAFRAPRLRTAAGWAHSADPVPTADPGFRVVNGHDSFFVRR